MKLVTAEVEKALLAAPLYSTESQNVAPVIVKFFDPSAGGTWYIIEAEKLEDGDWRFYGYVTGLGEDEWGYSLLSEMQEYQPAPSSMRLPIERDLYFEGRVIDKTTGQVRRAG